MENTLPVLMAEKLQEVVCRTDSYFIPKMFHWMKKKKKKQKIYLYFQSIGLILQTIRYERHTNPDDSGKTAMRQPGIPFSANP